MQVLLGRNPSSDRYPRWGYLDRHTVNPHMARAILTATLLQAVACGGYMGWQQLTRESHIPLRPFTRTTPAVIPLPRPQEPPQTPPILPIPQRSVTAVAWNSLLIPVEDEDVWRTDARHFSAHASGTGGGDGNGVDAPIDRGFAPTVEPPAVDPPQFVAFELAPELVTMEPPRYPEIARQAGVEGSVTVLVLVGADGFVEDAQLAGDGIAMLNPAALAAAETAVFKPALQADRPVRAWVAIPIQFDLRE